MSKLHEWTVWHERLNKSRVLRGQNFNALKQRAQLLMNQWEAEWQSKQQRDQKAADRELARASQARSKEQKVVLAETRTAEAEEVIRRVQELLKEALGRTPGIDWGRLADKSEFAKPKPQEPDLIPPSSAPYKLPTPPSEPVTPAI